MNADNADFILLLYVLPLALSSKLQLSSFFSLNYLASSTLLVLPARWPPRKTKHPHIRGDKTSRRFLKQFARLVAFVHVSWAGQREGLHDDCRLEWNFTNTCAPSSLLSATDRFGVKCRSRQETINTSNVTELSAIGTGIGGQTRPKPPNSRVLIGPLLQVKLWGWATCFLVINPWIGHKIIKGSSYFLKSSSLGLFRVTESN